MSTHEHNTRELRKAAGRVHKASDGELASALERFAFCQNEWFNSIPRDSMMRPVLR